MIDKHLAFVKDIIRSNPGKAISPVKETMYRYKTDDILKFHAWQHL